MNPDMLINLPHHGTIRLYVDRTCFNSSYCLYSKELVTTLNTLCAWGGSDHNDETSMSWEFAPVHRPTVEWLIERFRLTYTPIY